MVLKDRLNTRTSQVRRAMTVTTRNRMVMPSSPMPETKKPIPWEMIMPAVQKICVEEMTLPW